MVLNKKWGVLLVLSLIIFAAVATVLVYSFETKYFFSRNECRYIFKQGSCVVADEHCNLNSYNYVKKILDPRKDCVSEIAFNPGFEEEDLTAFDYPETAEATSVSQNGECPFVVMEADFVKIRPEAIDPDPDIGPAGKLIWTFFTPLNQKGEWQTKKGDAGIHNTKVTVSDGQYNDTKLFCIEVQATNHAPVIQKIADILAKEGDTV
ncbi:MAG: hypothetical protein KJ574_04310, partial [Nanoarchaeota archaeon]|nr:hypothetical protein [Nanoarchaeota archaeon]